ncbi:MAG: FIST signal transduction protein [Bacteriovoracia bacterium]
MELHTFAYSKKTGWTVDSFPKLDSEKTFVVLFGAPKFVDDPKPFKELKTAFPKSIICGCSTAGEVLGTKIQDETLVVSVCKFEKSGLRQTSIKVTPGIDSVEAGTIIAENLKEKDLRAVFILSDGINVNGSELIQGLTKKLSNDVVVTGGLAGDGNDFKRTWTLEDGFPSMKVVSAVGFYGPSFRISHGSQGGWEIFGPERIVTKSNKNILYEIDGKPALSLYKEYLGERAKELPAAALLFPICLLGEGNSDVVRTILTIDEKENSMTFAGNLPEGSKIRLMKATFDNLIEGASQAAVKLSQMQSKDKMPSGPVLAISISCVGRRIVLGQRVEDELESALSRLPAQTQQIGFYSYGEISPLTSGKCELHNQTMTITAISEVLE